MWILSHVIFSLFILLSSVLIYFAYNYALNNLYPHQLGTQLVTKEGKSFQQILDLYEDWGRIEERCEKAFIIVMIIKVVMVYLTPQSIFNSLDAGKLLTYEYKRWESNRDFSTQKAWCECMIESLSEPCLDRFTMKCENLTGEAHLSRFWKAHKSDFQ